MSVIDDVLKYETWLGTHCAVVRSGLEEKHERMARDAFMFFRATCFRFARKLNDWLPELSDAPVVPSVGDAHIENWGTWRDLEGRLVWGVNDFDDAADLPCTYDLLRLATSARLAKGLPGENKDRAAAILAGYHCGLAAPRPRLVDDESIWMQTLVNRPAAKAGAFGRELKKAAPAEPGDMVRGILTNQFCAGTSDIHFSAWQRGGGSLGRPRFVAEGTWRGGRTVREAKALVPSAWYWAGVEKDAAERFSALAGGRYRSPDPFLVVKSGFIIRRIAADSDKINLAGSDAQAYGPALLSAMGADLAAIHLSEGADPAAIGPGLLRRPPGWLNKASVIAEDEVREDFEKWRSYHQSTRGK
jgi:hypothetical protein